MRMFIDTEFNGTELISMALVADDGQSFYKVLGCRKPEPWVRDHVMPVLYAYGCQDLPYGVKNSQAAFTQNLTEFLNRFETVHVVADWPADIAFLCNEIITGPGERMDTPPLTFEVVRLDGDSTVPHNALSDAVGLRYAVWSAEQSEAVPDYCKLYTADEWSGLKGARVVIPSDGEGYWSTKQRFGPAHNSFGIKPAWATHVAWFNK